MKSRIATHVSIRTLAWIFVFAFSSSALAQDLSASNTSRFLDREM